MSEQLIVTFHTTSEAMATEFACKKALLTGKLIPVPRTLSAGCGIAWMARPEDRPALKALLETQAIEWDTMAILNF